MTILSPAFQQNWNFDGNPNLEDLTLSRGGKLFVGDIGIDTTTFISYVCEDSGNFDGIETISRSVWKEILFQNVSRTKIERISPQFNTSYQPSIKKDVEVNLTLNVTSLLAFTSTVDIQISIDNINWNKISSIVNNLGIAVNISNLYNFIVPVGSYYRIIQSIGNVSSIVSIFELTI